MYKLVAATLAFGAFIGLVMPSGSNVDAEPVSAEAAEEASEDGEGRETKLDRQSDGHFYVDAEVDGAQVNFLVDTGATSVALTIADAERLGIDFDREDFTVVGTGASGPVRGQVVEIDEIDIDGKSVTDVRGVVLDGLGISLLGQAYLSELDTVSIKGDVMTLD